MSRLLATMTLALMLTAPPLAAAPQTDCESNCIVCCYDVYQLCLTVQCGLLGDDCEPYCTIYYLECTTTCEDEIVPFADDPGSGKMTFLTATAPFWVAAK